MRFSALYSSALFEKKSVTRMAKRDVIESFIVEYVGAQLGARQRLQSLHVQANTTPRPSGQFS